MEQNRTRIYEQEDTYARNVELYRIIICIKSRFLGKYILSWLHQKRPDTVSYVIDSIYHQLSKAEYRNIYGKQSCLHSFGIMGINDADGDD